jgi:hypothetical protein
MQETNKHGVGKNRDGALETSPWALSAVLADHFTFHTNKISLLNIIFVFILCVLIN